VAIKSIQRGTATLAANSDNTTTNITISSVDTTKTRVNLLSSNSYNYGAGGGNGARNVYLQLTSATNLAATLVGANNITWGATVSWEVIEFY
jgi:hypothetical protein